MHQIAVITEPSCPFSSPSWPLLPPSPVSAVTASPSARRHGPQRRQRTAKWPTLCKASARQTCASQDMQMLRKGHGAQRGGWGTLGGLGLSLASLPAALSLSLLIALPAGSVAGGLDASYLDFSTRNFSRRSTACFSYCHVENTFYLQQEHILSLARTHRIFSKNTFVFSENIFYL